MMKKRMLALLLAVCLLVGMLPLSALAVEGESDPAFTEGRSIQFLAPTSYEIIGVLSDYNDGNIGLDKWTTNDTLENGGTLYSLKTIETDEDKEEAYCAYKYSIEDGYHVLTKTYNKYLSEDDIAAEGKMYSKPDGNVGIMMPYNGTGNSLTGYRFLAYNTKPDGSGDWYRVGQPVPDGIERLYAQFVKGLSLNLNNAAKASIQLNGTENNTEDEPYYVLVDADGNLNPTSSPEALYYTADMELNEEIARLIWARMDKIKIVPDTTSIKLTVDFQDGLDIFGDEGKLTFQYTGGFVPYMDGKFMDSDTGTDSQYTFNVTKDSDLYSEDTNTLTMTFGLDGGVNEHPSFSYKDYATMKLTVEGQLGAKAIITNSLMENVTENAPVDVITGGTVEVSTAVFLSESFPMSKTKTYKVDDAHAKLYQLQENPIEVKPADITIYMGGKEGYDSVVDGSGSIVASNSLPEPGFTVTMPDGTPVEDLDALTFSELDGERRWKFESYDGESQEVFKLVPAVEDQEATRVQFTDEEGNTVTSDEFDVGANVNTSYTMSLYKGSDVKDIVVEIENKLYPVDSSETGELTVRGTTQKAQYASVSETADQVESGEPGLVAATDTEYTINDSSVQANAEGVALLFDDIINTNEADRTTLLEQRAETYFQEASISPSSGNQFAYEFKYLDLVDTHNGNAWVQASQNVTVYWPIPDGADKISLKVLHFKGLHREMQTDQIGDEISKCDVELINPTVEDDHVTFEIGTAGFSPFALVWEEKASQPDPGPVNPGGTTPPALEKEDHIQYLFGYPDRSFGPERNMTRAEAAQMFHNLLEKKEYPITATFSDIPENGWYTTAVNTMASLGIVSGYEDGTFRPNQPITRAEFVAMAVKFLESPEAGTESSFTDVSAKDWFWDAVQAAVAEGWISGYGDGTFRPNRKITRTEVASIVNHVLERCADQDYVEKHQEELNAFTDVTPKHWGYYHIVEATNQHDYTKKNNCEKWTSSSFELR